MCCNSNGCCGKKSYCTLGLIGKILLVIGGINWGLVGAGMLAGNGVSLNVVNMALGAYPEVEAGVYLLVGVVAIFSIFGCKCSKCKNGVCGTCAVGEKCMCGGSCASGKCDKCGNVCENHNHNKMNPEMKTPTENHV